MKLYEINNKMEELLNGEVDEETGEVAINWPLFNSLEMAKEAKIESLINYYTELKGDIDKFSREAKRIQADKKTMENKADSIKRYLDGIHEGQKASYGTHKITYRSSKAVEGEERMSLLILSQDELTRKINGKKSVIKWLSNKYDLAKKVLNQITAETNRRDL